MMIRLRDGSGYSILHYTLIDNTIIRNCDKKVVRTNVEFMEVR